MPATARLIPFHDNIILEPIPGVTQVGLIHVPDSAVRPTNQGKVVDKGPDVSDRIELGSIVFFGIHTEARITWKGNQFIVVSEGNCLGTIIEGATPTEEKKKVPVQEIAQGQIVELGQYNSKSQTFIPLQNSEHHVAD